MHLNALIAILLTGLLALPLALSHANDSASTQVEPDYESLALIICSRAFGGSSVSPAKLIKNGVIRFMNDNNLSKSNPPSNQEIITLLNTHNQKLKCEGMHFITYLMNEGKGTVIVDNFILDQIYDETETVLFDFNIVSHAYNPRTKKVELMTILDFIEKVAFHDGRMTSSPSGKADYQDTRDVIIEYYNAVRFKDLPEAVQSHYLQRMMH